MSTWDAVCAWVLTLLATIAFSGVLLGVISEVKLLPWKAETRARLTLIAGWMAGGGLALGIMWLFVMGYVALIGATT